MKKLLTTIGLLLSLVLPASAEKIVKKQPTVPAYSLAAMGCMILLECTEGVEKLTSESELLKAKELRGKLVNAGLSQMAQWLAVTMVVEPAITYPMVTCTFPLKIFIQF